MTSFLSKIHFAPFNLMQTVMFCVIYEVKRVCERVCGVFVLFWVFCFVLFCLMCFLVVVFHNTPIIRCLLQDKALDQLIFQNCRFYLLKFNFLRYFFVINIHTIGKIWNINATLDRHRWFYLSSSLPGPPAWLQSVF